MAQQWADWRSLPPRRHGVRRPGGESERARAIAAAGWGGPQVLERAACAMELLTEHHRSAPPGARCVPVAPVMPKDLVQLSAEELAGLCVGQRGRREVAQPEGCRRPAAGGRSCEGRCELAADVVQLRHQRCGRHWVLPLQIAAPCACAAGSPAWACPAAGRLWGASDATQEPAPPTEMQALQEELAAAQNDLEWV